MRRSSILCIALLVCLPLAAEGPVQSINPDALWGALLVGNKHFVAGSITYPNLKQDRAQHAAKQLPPVTVLACSDSRVPPELVFNQTLGSLFVVRSVGNVVDSFGVASIEYAIANGYTHLLVVLGHEECGAVKSSLVLEDPVSPHLLAVVQRIRSSFGNVTYDYKDPANVRRAVEANTRASATALSAHSKIIREAVVTGKVKLVTAVYSLATGEVRKVD